MRTLIVSDIHSNIVALDAVIAAAEAEEEVSRVLCLGDIVGYGPSPMACIERLWERRAVSIKGNHDAAAVGQISLDEFNSFAAEACRWTSGQLTSQAKEWLGDLPETLHDESFLLVHGSPQNPLWDYLVSYGQAVDAWERSEMSDILVGHSHLQFAIEAGGGIARSGPAGLTIPLTRARLIANPGSVGQPRDRDQRAAFALYDDDARILYLRRAWYDVSATQRAMAEAGLPDPLITRLSVGM